jgi:hypothetical protein
MPGNARYVKHIYIKNLEILQTLVDALADNKAKVDIFTQDEYTLAGGGMLKRIAGLWTCTSKGG